MKDALIGSVEPVAALDREDDHRGPSQPPQRAVARAAPPPTPTEPRGRRRRQSQWCCRGLPLSARRATSSSAPDIRRPLHHHRPERERRRLHRRRRRSTARPITTSSRPRTRSARAATRTKRPPRRIAPADLRVSSMQAPPPAGAGASFTVTVTTQNQGVGTAEPTTTAVYLSVNSLFDATDQRLFETGIWSSGTGSVGDVDGEHHPSGGTDGRSYYLLRRRRCRTGRALESYETNNTYTRTLRIGPDLEVSALTVPQSAAPGSVISIGSTVTNEGGGDAGAFAVTFYLSANYNLDGTDTLCRGAAPCCRWPPAPRARARRTSPFQQTRRSAPISCSPRRTGSTQIAEALREQQHVAADDQDRRRSRRVVLDGAGDGRSGHGDLGHRYDHQPGDGNGRRVNHSLLPVRQLAARRGRHGACGHSRGADHSTHQASAPRRHQ